MPFHRWNVVQTWRFKSSYPTSKHHILQLHWQVAAAPCWRAKAHGCYRGIFCLAHLERKEQYLHKHGLMPSLCWWWCCQWSAAHPAECSRTLAEHPCTGSAWGDCFFVFLCFLPLFLHCVFSCTFIIYNKGRAPAIFPQKIYNMLTKCCKVHSIVLVREKHEQKNI